MKHEEQKEELARVDPSDVGRDRIYRVAATE
jgi:hypothetical protein